MTEEENILLLFLEAAYDPNQKAVLLQNFIAEHGPLSEEAGAKARELLGKKHD